ncbi:hypothetical protein LINGRAHAP2_LOCUS23478, partial [Linum grandiflorum]
GHLCGLGHRRSLLPHFCTSSSSSRAAGRKKEANSAAVGKKRKEEEIEEERIERRTPLLFSLVPKRRRRVRRGREAGEEGKLDAEQELCRGRKASAAAHPGAWQGAGRRNLSLGHRTDEARRSMAK